MVKKRRALFFVVVSMIRVQVLVKICPVSCGELAGNGGGARVDEIKDYKEELLCWFGKDIYIDIY